MSDQKFTMISYARYVLKYRKDISTKSEIDEINKRIKALKTKFTCKSCKKEFKANESAEITEDEEALMHLYNQASILHIPFFYARVYCQPCANMVIKKGIKSRERWNEIFHVPLSFFKENYELIKKG